MSGEYKSLNAADLAAAKRFIAQFNGESDGRHNSTALPGRQTETKPVEVEGTNELPVAYAPHGLRFLNGFQRYLLNLHYAMRCRQAVAEAQESIRWRYKLEAYEWHGSEFECWNNIAEKIKIDWKNCGIGDYCQIPEAPPFEQYNPAQIHVMLVPLMDRPLDLESWCGVRREMTQATRTFQQAILWNSEAGAQQFWKRIE